MKGSYLWSEPPVTFPGIIWESLKERSLSSPKCLTQSEEKGHVMSGERHSSLFRPLALTGPAPPAPLAGIQPAVSLTRRGNVTAGPAPRRTGRPAVSPSSSFRESPKWVHLLTLDPECARAHASSVLTWETRPDVRQTAVQGRPSRPLALRSWQTAILVPGLEWAGTPEPAVLGLGSFSAWGRPLRGVSCRRWAWGPGRGDRERPANANTTEIGILPIRTPTRGSDFLSNHHEPLFQLLLGVGVGDKVC